MKYILIFLFGFVSSMFIITCTDFKTWHAADFIPYIGPAILGGVIYLNFVMNEEKINNLEQNIKDLHEKINKLKEK